MTKIEFDKERRKALVAAVRQYFKDQFGEEIGEMKAGFLLDFFTQHLGPPIYNQAIRDAQSYIQQKAIELEDVLYQFER